VTQLWINISTPRSRAGALVRENFGRPIKVNVEEAHDIKLELDVRSQALITDYQSTRAPINILKAEFDNLRASQLQIPHKPKNGEVRKGTAVRFDLSKGAGTIPLP
jgi:hypothetical protein